MKTRKLFIGLVLSVCMVATVGCSSNIVNPNPNEEQHIGNNEQTVGNNEQSFGTEQNYDDILPEDFFENNDANYLLQNSSIQGSVLRFTDTGCVITPVTISDDNEAVVDAPGVENPDIEVNVHYQENCIFKIANINSNTGVVAYEDTGIENVKKQTSVILLGKWNGKKDIYANAVIIARYQ